MAEKVKMKGEVEVKESLSALLDGELDELTFRSLLKTLSQDDAQSAELLARWQRYQLFSAALRGEVGAAEMARPEFSATVSEALADEAPPVELRARLSSWRRVAIAASVALAAIISVQQLQIDDRSAMPLLAVNGEKNNGAHALSESSPLPTGRALAEAQQQLNDYLLQHASEVAQQGGQGLVPFVRLASFSGDENTVHGAGK